MKTLLTYVVLGSAVLGVSACTSETKARWNSEAGAQIDNGYFGNAHMHNMVAQTCSGPAGHGGGYGGGGYKGGSVADPVVVLDPASTPTRPIYRVHCSGNLNGKYAQVVFEEYVRSAVPEVEDATIESAVSTEATSE